jgi:dUTP pyrophosphatase
MSALDSITKIEIKKLNPEAVLPVYQTEHAAGLDVSACIDAPVTIEPHARAIIPTGFAIALPAGYEAQIRARSGMAAKFGVVPANGVGTIDADYRGEVGVILLNTSDMPFNVEPGMRIAQMVIAKYERIDWEEVAELDTTQRATGGYGSTGA